MSIYVSKDNVSPLQKNYLSKAKSMPPLLSPELFEILKMVLTDSEIASGEESLDPEWSGIYEKAKNRPRRYISQNKADELRVLFESIKSFDEGLSLIDPNNSQITFLLGAGASKPEPSGIPTVKELLPDMLSKARRLDRDDVTKLATFCDENNIVNIEDLLTAVQLSEFCSRNPSVHRLVEFLIFPKDDIDDPRSMRRRSIPTDKSSVAFLQDTLQVLFGLLASRMLPADPNNGHLAIADYVLHHPASSIVTTNYDCCIDLALIRGKIPFSYMIDFTNDIVSIEHTNQPTKLIKLHGSLNWFYCETCQSVQLINIENTVSQYKSKKALYPVIAVCNDCGGQRRGLLVPPLAMRFDLAPPLNPLLDSASEVFKESDIIVVVGFSFADADLYISRMLSKAIQSSDTMKMLIIDPDITIADKVRRKFLARIPNFDSSRILAIRRDCAEELPNFLQGKLFGSISKPPRESAVKTKRKR